MERKVWGQLLTHEVKYSMLMCSDGVYFVYRAGPTIVTSARRNYQGKGGMLIDLTAWMLNALQQRLDEKYNEMLCRVIKKKTIVDTVGAAVGAVFGERLRETELKHGRRIVFEKGGSEGMGEYERYRRNRTCDALGYVIPNATIRLLGEIGEGASATVWKGKVGSKVVVVKVSKLGRKRDVVREWKGVEAIMEKHQALPIPRYYGCFESVNGQTAAIVMEMCGEPVSRSEGEDEIPAAYR